MFNSVLIENFRDVKHLEIDNLCRVNLFVGKNNAGKTSVLEAISILAVNNQAEQNEFLLMGWIYKLIYNREPEIFNVADIRAIDFSETNRRIISSIISGRSQELFSYFLIKAKCDIENDPFKGEYYSDSVKIIFAANHDEESKIVYPNGETRIEIRNWFSETKEELEKKSIDLNKVTSLLHLQTNSNNRGAGRPISIQNDNRASMFTAISSLYNNNVQFVTANILDNNLNSALYDRIVFDEFKLTQVHNALKFIEPNLEKFAFQANESNQRVGRIKLKGVKELISLGSMGDGMNRILVIILAIVNCQNGYLFIDEFENGLHYSIQEKLWGIIFILAESLNVQIFVTTHSNDTIHAFSNALSKHTHNTSAGKATRLQKIDELIIAVEYSNDELETSQNFDIEIR